MKLNVLLFKSLADKHFSELKKLCHVKVHLDPHSI